MQSFPDYQVDDGPAQEQGTGQLPLEAPEVLDGAGDVQHAGAGTKRSCIWLGFFKKRLRGGPLTALTVTFP